MAWSQEGCTAPSLWRSFSIIDRDPSKVNDLDGSSASLKPPSASDASAAGVSVSTSKPGQWTVEDATTFSKKCDPYEQGGKPLDAAHALALMDTV